MKILLIYGGQSTEHNISILSAKSILKHINCDSVYITKENIWLYNNNPIKNIIDFLKTYDKVFPITHGSYGEDGNLQGFLNLFNIPYVGTKIESYICMDKERTKQIIKSLNIPQLDYQVNPTKLDIKFPVIIKPANGGSSIGINIATTKNEYKTQYEKTSKYDNKVIVEKFVNCRELECAVIKKTDFIMNIGEIISSNKFYDYEAKYESDSKTIINPDIPLKIKNQIYEYSKIIFNEFNLKDYARIDFFYYKNKIYFNEINTLPGFTNISMFPKLIMDKGYSYEQLLNLLLK